MKTKTILISLGIFFLIAAFGFWRWKKTDKDITYRSIQISRGDLMLKTLATGTVQPENRLEIKPPVAGRIERVLVIEGQKVRKGQILAWMSSSERAALIDAAHAQSPDEVTKWESLYKPTPIIAPISGMIIQRSVEAGQTFTTNDPVLVMSDRLTVKAQVDETDLAKIKLKQIAEIRLDAYPDLPIESIVSEIAFEAKTVNNVTTYVIVVVPQKPPEVMRSGMTANVTFFGDVQKNVIKIENEFIQYKQGTPQALIQKKPDQKPDWVDLQIGMTDGKSSEVLAGLNENDLVVLEIQKKEEKSSNPFSPMGNSNRSNNRSPRRSN
ncbi:MAG: efflux RND transporter periplasmic adaptor subunit [Pseudobdellovibrionaceae bacterium]